MFYDTQLAARILKTVRDNKGIGMAALREKLGIPDQNLDSTDSTPVGDFEIILIDLIKCRLVEGISDEGKGEAIDIDGLPSTSLNGSIVFFPSKLVKKFQTIFGLSLSEIAKNPPGLSITSVPLFGPPE